MPEKTKNANENKKEESLGQKIFKFANEGTGNLGAGMGAIDSVVDLSDVSDDTKANVSIASGFFNAGAGAMGAIQAGKDIKDAKNGTARAKGILDMASSISNMGGGAASMAKGGLKKGGNEEGADAAEKAGGFFGLLGGITGTASSSMDIHEARTKKNEEINKKIQEINADPSITNKKAAIKEAKKEINKKYSGDLFSGSMGIIGNLLGAGSGIASMIGGATGQLLGGILGGAGNIIGMLGSLGGLFGGKKEEESDTDTEAGAANDSGNAASADAANDAPDEATRATGPSEGQTADAANDAAEEVVEEDRRHSA